MGKIAALIVILGILNIIIFIMIYHIVKSINHIIKLNIMNGLSIYDEIIAKKEAEIELLNETRDSILSKEDFNSVDEKQFIHDMDIDFLMANYYDNRNQFKFNYRRIKDAFHYDYVKIVNEFLHSSLVNNEKDQYSILRDKIDFKLMYKLSTVDKQIGYELLFHSLDSPEREILTEYLKEYFTFDIVQFCNYLDFKSKEYGNEIIVRMREPDKTLMSLDANIVLEKDDEIIEGIKIIYHNTLYDYSV